MSGFFIFRTRDDLSVMLRANLILAIEAQHRTGSFIHYQLGADVKVYDVRETVSEIMERFHEVDIAQRTLH